ncbi:hypothetical protein AK812_SmicGene11194 [Symbiodinium microadriaticum]|uniref:Uncharacterized protein n=1 Tax=Symbiodinium microadriaticum TaxID=2951 RepID=A0A1Q9EDS4_SYMMI|nr:hypothetical protein AK812_SmicGene11194 [Symbiodinium microadriaticum]
MVADGLEKVEGSLMSSHFGLVLMLKLGITCYCYPWAASIRQISPDKDVPIKSGCTTSLASLSELRMVWLELPTLLLQCSLYEAEDFGTHCSAMERK